VAINLLTFRRSSCSGSACMHANQQGTYVAWLMLKLLKAAGQKQTECPAHLQSAGGGQRGAVTMAGHLGTAPGAAPNGERERLQMSCHPVTRRYRDGWRKLLQLRQLRAQACCSFVYWHISSRICYQVMRAAAPRHVFVAWKAVTVVCPPFTLLLPGWANSSSTNGWKQSAT
jgi:hypothetical protein